MSDPQVMVTTNGLTADMKSLTGVQMITKCPAAMAHSHPLLAFAQTAVATSLELLLRWNSYFRRIHRNSLRSRLQQLPGLTEAERLLEFRGTQYSKLVADPISQRLLPQL